MSASVATPMAGLPKHNMSPQQMSDYTANDFDHMAPDRSNASIEKDGPQNQSKSAQQASEKNLNDDERSQAVGNLLAALSSNSQANATTNGPSPDGSIQPARQNGGSPNQNLHMDMQNEVATNAEFGQLPDWNIPNATLPFSEPDLPDVDPNDADFVSNAESQQISQSIDQHNFPIDPMGEFAGTIPDEQPAPVRTRVEYEAFGKLVFQDGNFYLNTYAIELGRDVHAFRAAIAREQEEREERAAASQGKHKPRSSGNRSHVSGRHVGSQVQGSIVSEVGGFAGVDDEAADKKEMQPPGQTSLHHSSQASDASATVKPHEVLMDPKRIPQFDYHKRAAEYAAEHGQATIEDDEKPAAVTEDHLPNPHMIPLIPIHGTMQTAEADVEGHKAISRRHVRISWNFQKDQWEMTVLGRNGAFLNGDFKKQGWTVKIDHGSKIQISHVEMTFCLPTQPEEHTKEESEDETLQESGFQADDAIPSIERRHSETPLLDRATAGSPDSKTTLKINLKGSTQTPMVDENGEIIRGPDGKPVYKKRGPGRPPKNGIMSNRELKEREKARKAEEAKAANGGKTPPPPLVRGKVMKPGSTEPLFEDKSEKRKYKKRKRLDENGQPIPSVDGEESDQGEDEERKAKKARPQREKSESPEYPAKETLTSEQLQRPTDPYATLLYKLLMEVWPEALALKQIYRLMKQKWPYFVHEVGTEGWQSSVRHNLNSEYMKLFDKGDKEGKGYAWKAIPNAALPQQDRKKAASQQAPPKPKPPQQKPPYPPGPGQISFHNTTAFPPPNGPQGMMNNGQWQSPNPGQPQNWQGSGPQIGNPAQPGSLQQVNPPLANGVQRTSGPQVQMNGQTPTSTPPNGMPAQQPPAISGGSAPSNMPCTWAGIEAIKKFEQELMKQLDGKGPRSRDFWVVAFKSASRRCLHGATESLLDEADTKEEETLVSHINFFVKNFANPNFKGFTNQANRSTIASAPGASTPSAQSTTPAPQVPAGISTNETNPATDQSDAPAETTNQT